MAKTKKQNTSNKNTNQEKPLSNKEFWAMLHQYLVNF